MDKEEKKSLASTRDDSTESEDSEVLEFEFNDDGEEDLKKTIKKLRADLKACKKEKDEYVDFDQEKGRAVYFSRLTHEKKNSMCPRMFRIR